MPEAVELDARHSRLADEPRVFPLPELINSPGGEPKLEAICRRISNVRNRRDALVRRARDWVRLAEAHSDLLRSDGLGGFMAYEIACDLRYTKMLEYASDKMVWSNPGPGAVRGLYRVLGDSVETNCGHAGSTHPRLLWR